MARLNLLATASRFGSAEGGNVAVLFTFAVLPLMGMALAGIDYSAATRERTRLQAATDAAALAVLPMANGTNDAEVRTAAQKMLWNYKPNLAQGDPANFNLTPDGLTVKVTAPTATAPGTISVQLKSQTQYKTQMVSLASDVIPMSAAARAQTTKTTFEIALVLDNSGSMASSASGKTKMQAAKDAAQSLATKMLGTNTAGQTQRTRISVVPFTLTVNVGTQHASATWLDKEAKSSKHWDNFTHEAGLGFNSRFDILTALGQNWSGCLEHRPGTWGVTDAPPSSTHNDSLFVPYFAPDEPGRAGQGGYSAMIGETSYELTYPNSYVDDDKGVCTGAAPLRDALDTRQKRMCKYKNPTKNLANGRGPNRGCDAKPITRMSDQAATVSSAINAMQAAGNTNLVEGFMWGWRTITPNAPFSDGKSYADPDNRKIIVFLTDGMNAWNSAYNHNLSVFSPFGYYNDGRLTQAGKANPTTAPQARAQMDERTLTACKNARDKDVVVYTVGFSTPTDAIDAAGLKILNDCASPDPEDKTGKKRLAYVATNAKEIMTVFDEIAAKISNTRIAE